ncbi:MAG: diguanylate cyclase, partial [Clostridia bacterium]
STRRHNTEIVTANQRYQSLLSNINGGMIVASHAPNIDGTLVKYVSHGFTDMTGYTLEDINTLFQGKYLSVLIDEDRNVAFDTYLEQLSAGKTYHMPYRIRKKDGGLLWVMDNGYVVNDGKLINNHSIITDISTLKQQEEALRLSENRFSVAIHASSGALFEVDLKKKLYTHFENAERIFGTSSKTLLDDTRPFSLLSFDDFVKTTTDYFFHPDDRDIANKGMELLIENKTVSYEARLRKYDNTYIWARIDLSLTNDEYGDPSVLIGFMSDINDIKKESERLEVKVNSDSMTGIYNKSALVQLTNKILRENQDKRHALIVIDIDNFKGLNDTLGHAFGDVVLIESAAKLKSIFRGNDIVGRMGGDEFAVVMENIPDKNLALKKAAEISKTIRQTYSGQKNDYSISCSIGVVIIEENNTDPFETLYRKADAALYQAKECGKDMFVLYDESEAQNYPIESKRTNDEELQNLATYHNPEEYIFELLYTTKNFDASINKALAVIGRQYNVSRAYIFENDDLNRYTSNIYEWCNDDISPQISNLQNIEFSLGETSLLNCYDKNGLLYCSDVRELPSTPRKILEAQGVLSTLQMIISDDEKIYGFIGFDECTKYRVWTTEEIEKLSFLSKVLSVFLFKEKAKVALLKNLNTRLKILDVLPDYICVVNPETHSIVYSNSKLQKLIPTVQTGAFCFSSLRGGQNSPCKTCLVERIKIGDTDNLEIISEDKNIR